MRTIIAMMLVSAGLVACAAQPGNRSLVVHSAPRVSEFAFDGSPPLSAAAAFEPWAKLSAENTAEDAALDACIADRDQCATGNLIRYRRLLELAAELTPAEQLDLVQEYFNTVEQTLDTGTDSPNDWASVYLVASTHRGDCKGIALSKYFTLRRLGWDADDLRVVMNWDDHEGDWHALLAARMGGRTYMLDSILGLQRPRAFSYGYMVYSISENGVWDHAPDFVPVP